ncbi:MAG: sulfatase-like hydrolase/transferase, partial [Pirellulales bacterium]|nr:sulfatase-like hydrolase/transferase [Pirellulales bacterium]
MSETAYLVKRHANRCSVLVVAGLLAWWGNVIEAGEANDSSGKRPNVVLIMTDNHGAWTLGCYGNSDIRTPNIDRLAAQGVRFTHAFASNPVCSPTRATFLTGLMPSQHGVHSFLGAGNLQIGPAARCTLDHFTSLPEILRDAGYSCGLVGKWHLGDNLHPQEGLDDYWVTMPHGGTNTFYGAEVIEDGQVRREPTYLTDFWTDHAVKFIDQQADRSNPFFLFLAYNGPYSLGRLLLRDGQNRHAAYYADQPLASFPRQAVHPWQLNNRDFIHNPTSIRRVATEVSGVDDGVGRVMSALQRHGLDRDTVVVFVADQGWVGGQGGFFGMGDHTRPLTARDGMMQIPMIWRHPQRIPAGTTADQLISNYDFMPTLLGHLDLPERMPASPRSPGADLSNVLAGKVDRQDSPPPQAVFYEFENLRCVRTQTHKYVHRFPNGPHELYALDDDPDEFANLVNSPQHQLIRDQLRQRLFDFFDQYATAQYDLWNGGTSQVRIHDGVDEKIVSPRPVAPPPLPEDYQPAPLRVPEGYEAELVAGPPLVTHPTMACFDDRGRLYVCNNAGVNMTNEALEANLPNSIRRLVDTDGDGKFDQMTVFADQMTFPMGGVWHQDALYVASPPYIWRLRDTDDDGIADRREIIVRRFGYNGNAASIHGCFFGPDGRLYWTDGYHGHEFKDEQGKVVSQREGSYLFSCRPDGSDVTIHCGGGMDNPVEIDFTEGGDMLGTVNILYTRPRVDALVHWLHGGAYPHRERVLDEIQVTGALLGPVHRFGHVAVSGMTRYRSGVIDHRFGNDLFATFFNSGKVVRIQLEPEGSSFCATQHEFLSSSSREFHPTDVLEDADGSLLVVDTGGWFYRGCPTSQFSKPELLGGIYRIRRSGMTTLVDPRGKRIDWETLSAAEL